MLDRSNHYTMPKKDAEHALPSLTVTRTVASERLDARIESGRTLLAQSIASAQQLEAEQRKFYTWNDYNETLLRAIFDNGTVADDYRKSLAFFGKEKPSLREDIDDYHGDVEYKLRKIESIKERLELYAEKVSSDSASPHRAGSKVKKDQQVFIVHGRDTSAKLEVVRFLEKLSINAQILHEQPSGSRTVIEKLEHYGAMATFAVVLLTGDDMGSLKNTGDLRPRARQNVILELGYFLGSLTRQNVCALYEEGVELPSDYEGVVFVPLDTNGAWKMLLARELKAVGFAVDMNKAL